MKKRFLGITMAALLAFSCAGFVMAEEAPDCSGDPEVTLVYAEVNPLETTVVGQVAMHFAERINELTSDILASLSKENFKRRAFGWRGRAVVERNLKKLGY